MRPKLSATVDSSCASSGHGHTIPPCSLAAIQSLIRGIDQRFGGAPVVREYSYPHGGGYLSQGTAAVLDVKLLDGFSKEFRTLERHRPGTLGHYEGKFLTTVSTSDIFAADVTSEQNTQLLEQQVARFMSKGVVKILEVIKIDHDHSQGALVAGSPTNFQLERFFHEPAVEQAGQRITDRLAAQRFVQAQIG